jgi:8-oxo-dGTP pyrophosphatase MutT (NUDIX family)
MKRLPRDVSVHLFKPAEDGRTFLMLRRCRARGGFWQGVSGAPLADETDTEGAIREVLEETGFDVTESIFPLGVSYSYALRLELSAHWEQLYGPGVERVSVVSFAAELSGADPVLDQSEHDAFAWCSYEEADALLDWPIEQDARAGRRQALRVLNAQLQSDE